LFTVIVTLLSITMNAQMAITMPAEYEKNEGVFVTWPYQADYDSIIAEISGYAASSGDVLIIYNPDSVSADTNYIRTFLQSTGNNHDNINFIPGYNNTFYIRQYGPVAGYGVFDQSLVRYYGDPVFDAYNRPADDSIPLQLANYRQTDYVQYTLAFEQGNVLIDGEKNIFVSKHILEENLPLTEAEVKQQLSEIYNISDVTLLETPLHSGGGSMKSLDMFMKLLDSETVLFTEIPDTLPDHDVIENNVSIIEGLTNVYEAPYKIVRVKAAPLQNGKYDTTLNGEFRSYTNSLILNDLILVPSYNNPDYDSAAFHAYKENTYGMTVKMIDATKLSVLHAGIHTITKEEPQEHFLRISHQKVESEQNYPGDEYTITCMASADVLIDNMWLYYRFNSDTAWQKTTVHLVCPTHYGVIENVQLTDTVHYYLEANAVNSNSVTYPLSAPAGSFSFWFDITGTKQISSESNGELIFPNPVSGSITVKNLKKKVPFKIFDIRGKEIVKGTVAPQKKILLNNSMQPGIYLLQLETTGDNRILKFIKK